MKSAKQRKQKKFIDKELWNLDHSIAEFALPRLIRFKAISFGCPNNLTKENWDKILDQIIYAMQAINDEWNDELWSKEKELKINKGLVLFGKSS